MFSSQKLLIIFSLIFSSYCFSADVSWEQKLRSWKKEFHALNDNKKWSEIRKSLYLMLEYFSCEEQFMKNLSTYTKTEDKGKKIAIQRVFRYLDLMDVNDCLQDLIKELSDEGLQDLVPYLIDLKSCFSKYKKAMEYTSDFPRIYFLHIILSWLAADVPKIDQAKIKYDNLLFVLSKNNKKLTSKL